MYASQNYIECVSTIFCHGCLKKKNSFPIIVFKLEIRITSKNVFLHASLWIVFPIQYREMSYIFYYSRRFPSYNNVMAYRPDIGLIARQVVIFVSDYEGKVLNVNMKKQGIVVINHSIEFFSWNYICNGDLDDW